MNSLTLRISKGGGKKTKNAGGFAPVDVTKFIPESLGPENNNIQTFLNAKTAEEQLQVLRTCLSEENVGENVDVIRFLVKVFFNAEPKHPVKCFLARQITKNPNLHQPFTDVLSQELKYSISTPHINTCKDYISVVSKLATCIENFQPGSAAMKMEELGLSKYFDACLTCCINTLKTQSLSPTEKNEIFNLSHLALRLLLHIIQRISPENASQLEFELSSIKNVIQELLFDQDMPMDTKSICGILFVTIYLMENGQEAWIVVLQPTKDTQLTTLLANEASQLALYSAVATIAAMDVLQSRTVNEESALIVLCKKMLEIGDRYSSEPVFTLGVTRTVVHISKQMDKLTEFEIGISLVEYLLTFVWGHLEHYMDSVRHLTALMLSHIVKYCSKLDKDGHPEALTNMFATLNSLDRGRKSFFVSVTALANELGAAEVLKRLELRILIVALNQQSVQACATTALETLLQKHVKETTTEAIYNQWFSVIVDHLTYNILDSSVLNILENLMAKAVKLDADLIELIKPQIRHHETEIRCVLMLLNVARKSGAIDRLALNGSKEDPDDEQPLWRGIIRYEALDSTAGNSLEETRILTLSLIVESPKTTEMFSQGELNFILYFLKYNINAQSPNFRQIMLSLMKKFIKRLEDSFKVVQKQNLHQLEYFYLSSVQCLRELCFHSLLPGANYGRRYVALQVLVWCEQISLGGRERIWTAGYVEILLLHLEDSYENNKALALDILNKCPIQLLTRYKYSTSLDLDDILKQASALKPTECVSAAYKLDLLRTRLPDCIVAGESCGAGAPLPATYSLLRRLAAALAREVAECERSVARAAIDAPMYGLLHCMVHTVGHIDVRAISCCEQWKALFADVISLGARASAAVGGVVNSSSPEGHLPADTGAVGSDYSHTGAGVTLADGRLVTAQMVLLCAWRSVKEVSLLLGAISSRLLILGEDGPDGTLAPADLVMMGEHFTKLLAETKHRGAFEQAYVGFTKLLTRLWRCRSPALHELPRRWLDELMTLITRGGAGISTTRRGAGLPYMIQALVTTELQVNGNAKCFHDSMTTLLRLARTPKTASNCTRQSETDRADLAEKCVSKRTNDNEASLEDEREPLTSDAACRSESDVETRTHSLNILRALFRNAALDESVAGYVEEGLVVALEGFEGNTWMERNASTLLFSALMVRVFGVQRSRSEALCARNRMTGRIFFLRYPRLYDFMLAKLRAAPSADASPVLRPSLFPVLLLLARLYPSSLEGTVSSLKLTAFVPCVVACAGGAALLTRRLAARALPPLVAPHDYVEHLISTLDMINDCETTTNKCHGLLLQIRELLGAKPKFLRLDTSSEKKLQYSIHLSMWLLRQACGNNACYLLADEWTKMINLFIKNFPCSNLVQFGSIERILTDLIYSTAPNISAGREICLSNAVNLYLVQRKQSGYFHMDNSPAEVMCKLLLHESYDVTLAALNFVLNSHRWSYRTFNRLFGYCNESNVFDGCETKGSCESRLVECSYSLLEQYKSPEFIRALCELIKRTKYLECKQKALKLLTWSDNAEKHIVAMKINSQSIITDDLIVDTLMDCLENEHESLTDLYLETLSRFVRNKLKKSSFTPKLLLGVLRTMFGFSCCDRSELCRLVVVGFMQDNLESLHRVKSDGWSAQDKFEFKTTLYAALLVLLEDDNEILGQLISTVIAALYFSYFMVKAEFLRTNCRIISTRAAEILKELIKNEEQAAMLVTFALLDFKTQVCLSDETGDECKVFDQNEKYNIYAEESVWTDSCANEIILLSRETRVNPTEFVLDIIRSEPHKAVIEKLCNDNVVMFEKMVNNERLNLDVNPKIRLFVDKLKSQCVSGTRFVSLHDLNPY